MIKHNNDGRIEQEIICRINKGLKLTKYLTSVQWEKTYGKI